MKHVFYKYQGAGNDFVMLDNRTNPITLTNSQIALICDRRFGVGADGLILLENSEVSDFKMVYFNSDGALGSMCGNGGRCAVAFAKSLQLFSNSCVFEAFDGLHNAAVLANGTISLGMSDVTEVSLHNKNYLLDTGSPHLVCFVDDVKRVSIKEEGAKTRYSEAFIKEGVNVNFVEIKNGSLIIRTYERGVEDETLACGTGATATAIAAFEAGLIKSSSVKLVALGGDLEVSFKKVETTYTDIKLIGAAEFVFKGNIHV
jgi:diaminopimelate epimerase